MVKHKKNKKNKKKSRKAFFFIIALIILLFLLSKLFIKNLKIVEKEIVFDSKGNERIVKIQDRQGWIEKMNPDEKQKKSNEDVESLSNQSKATFTDIFSGLAWIEDEKTSLD